MSLFDWFRKKTKGEAPAPVETANEANGDKKVPPPPKGAEQPPESEVTRWIARWTKNVEGGDGEARSLASGLEGLRDSPEVVEALSLLSVRRGEVQEELAITASKLWSERGERNKAMEMLEGRVSARALFALGAHAEALANLSDALAYYERVLLRDYDFLGARERVSHLREKLGIGAKQASKRETIVAARDDGPGGARGPTVRQVVHAPVCRHAWTRRRRRCRPVVRARDRPAAMIVTPSNLPTCRHAGVMCTKVVRVVGCLSASRSPSERLRVPAVSRGLSHGAAGCSLPP